LVVENKHQHVFTKWSVRPIKVIKNPHYVGTAGDRAFLVKECACGKVEARDYGSTAAMYEKLEQVSD
jgi:hypothetical protein